MLLPLKNLISLLFKDLSKDKTGIKLCVLSSLLKNPKSNTKCQPQDEILTVKSKFIYLLSKRNEKSSYIHNPTKLVGCWFKICKLLAKGQSKIKGPFILLC